VSKRYANGRIHGLPPAVQLVTDLTLHYTLRTYEQLLDQVQTYADILANVFPGTNPDELAGRDASELAQIVARHVRPASLPEPADYLSHAPTSIPTSSSTGHAAQSRAGADDDSGSDEPGPERTWDESTRPPPTIVATDDNNAVSVATDQSCRPSFVGVTSMRNALRAIFRVYPAAKDHAVRRSKDWTAVVPPPASQVAASSSKPMADDAFGNLKKQRCVDFFFDEVHPITPFVNEEHFRAGLRSGRRDPSWLGLLSVVLALGSIASGSDALHEVYYQEMRSFLNFDTLGTGNLESLQALCLLGGYYLHYRNSPNMAFAVLGAANRMAIALGLHREESCHDATAASAAEPPGSVSRVEWHRRTWWGLFCLDTWTSMSLGRPTCGRWDPGAMDAVFPSLQGPDDRAMATLRASCTLCLICNRIQDRFAQFRSPLRPEEALAFDVQLQAWHETLSPLVFSAPESPHRLSTAGEFLRQRYTNVRLMLFRSILFRITADPPRRLLSPDESRVLELCHAASAEAVDSIALHWIPNRMHVWSSAWYLFQACMAPLLCLALDKAARSMEPEEHVISWRDCVAKALQTFSDMRPWMRASDRTPDIVAAIFEALTVDIEGVDVRSTVSTLGPGFVGDDMGFAGFNDEHWTFGMDVDWNALQLDPNLQLGMDGPA